jgi:hypothetical protein
MKELLVPSVGSRIRLKTKHRNYVVTRPGKFYTNEYEGAVITYPWLKRDEIALSVSGMKHTPIVRISNSDVSVEMLSGSFKRLPVSEEIITKSVVGSKGDIYQVSNKSGQWTCTCPGFTFRKRCKHTNI